MFWMLVFQYVDVILPKKRSCTLFYCFTEQRFTENNTLLSKGSRKKRVLMASGIGTNVSVVPGDPLRIGMLPVMLSHLSDNICSLKKRGPMEKWG